MLFCNIKKKCVKILKHCHFVIKHCEELDLYRCYKKIYHHSISTVLFTFISKWFPLMAQLTTTRSTFRSYKNIFTTAACVCDNNTPKLSIQILTCRSITADFRSKRQGTCAAPEPGSLFGYLVRCVRPEDSSWARVRPLLEQRPCRCGVCACLCLITLGQTTWPCPPAKREFSFNELFGSILQ